MPAIPLSDAAAQDCFLITASDTEVLEVPVRGISFATAGALKIRTSTGRDVAIPAGALAAGLIHPIVAIKVWSTGTTATSIVGYV